MLVALIENSRRHPAPGLKGTCPGCGLPAVAKCGPLKAWHWAHKGRLHCDPWWENETDWHRAWKQCFHLDWQEIPALDQKGEKHVADIKTPSGLVIEFQNSPMSIPEMRSREQFYGRMIWVVNATSFRDNLVINHLPLPPPGEPMLLDVQFIGDLASSYPCIGFYRPSTFTPGRSLELFHRYEEIEDDIKRAHDGHFALTWRRAKDVWLEASKPVFFDTGREFLELVRYPNCGKAIYGARRVELDAFLALNGGRASDLLKSIRR